jgi:hypothetical protein
VVIHNHPYYVSLIAAVGMLPELVHHTGGEIDTPRRAVELAANIGSSNLVIGGGATSS